MGKHRDLAGILLLVIIGMFIPFLGSLLLNFNLDMNSFDSWWKIGSTFSYFLLIFAIEMLVVFIYFNITSKIAIKKIDEYKP